jgi:Protein of unknown function (DUF3467)
MAEPIETGETAENDAGESTQTAPRAQNAPPIVTWDDSNMSTSYANVVNVVSTREEVTLFFGTNQSWDVRDSREVTVQLSDRIVLNPYAAKQL